MTLRSSIRPTLFTCLLALLASCGGQIGATDDETIEGSTEALRICGVTSTLRGIDVSEFQGTIDWPRVRASGVEFAFIRASYGRSRIDATFAANWARAAAAGVKRGAYQFYRPSQDPIQQADVLLETMGNLAAGDLPPVIDVEVGEGAGDATIVNGVRRWLERVEAATGVRPIVYTSWGFWSGLSGASSLARYPLWVANYDVRCPEVPTNTWSAYSFWQYSDHGRVSGISGPVDLDVFQGTRAQLDALGRPATAVSIALDWTRTAAGNYEFRASAPSSVARIELRTDNYVIGSASQRVGGSFAVTYRYESEGPARRLEVLGFDANGAQIARGVGAIDVGAGVGIFVKPVAASVYEIGLEQAPSAVAAIEVRADGFLLTDSGSGSGRSARRAVRSAFLQLGSRAIEIRTFNADGSLRGTLRRTVTLE